MDEWVNIKDIVVSEKKYWHLKDIQHYLQCGKNVASQVRQLAISKYNGLCFYNKKKVKKESCLQAIEEMERG